MIIQFIELSEKLREGGLEKAAHDLASYLNGNGIKVIRDNGQNVDINSVDLVHFHGLWAPRHFGIARIGATRTYFISMPAEAWAPMVARMVHPNSSAFSRDITTTAAAPSLMIEALPAVANPSF